MYQALVLVVLFYAALAACQGIPMPGARNPPPARPRPSPVANPAEVARILHNHCTRFFIESPDLSTRPGSSGSTSSSDSDILVISGGRGGRATRYTRRAEDTPPAMLLAVCRRSDGQWRRVNLNLNRCFGWDRQGMRFTVQPNGYGFARGGCVDCSYRPPLEDGDGAMIRCVCRSRPRIVPNHGVLATEFGVIAFDPVGGRLSCHGMYGNDLGPSMEPYRRPLRIVNPP